MAELSDTDRALIWAQYMETVCARQESLTSGGVMTKQELRAAVDAVDDWVAGNQGAYNTAIPLAARNALTVRQKAELLLFVVRKRWEVG